jgi:hypothetical protein
MEANEIATENDVRAFTFRYLGLSSRFVFNEAPLLFLEVKLTFTRGVVTLIKATLSRGSEKYTRQRDRDAPSRRRSLSCFRLVWAVPGLLAHSE